MHNPSSILIPKKHKPIFPSMTRPFIINMGTRGRFHGSVKVDASSLVLDYFIFDTFKVALCICPPRNSCMPVCKHVDVDIMMQIIFLARRLSKEDVGNCCYFSQLERNRKLRFTFIFYYIFSMWNNYLIIFIKIYFSNKNILPRSR